MKMMIVVSHPVHLTVLVEKERDTVEGTMNVIWLVIHSCINLIDFKEDFYYMKGWNCYISA